MIAVLILFGVTLLIQETNDGFIDIREWRNHWFKSDPVTVSRECHADTMICELNTAGTIAMANRSTLVSIDGSLLQRCLDNKDMTENDCPRDSESRLSFDFESTLFTDFVSYLESGRT